MFIYFFFFTILGYFVIFKKGSVTTVKSHFAIIANYKSSFAMDLQFSKEITYK